MFKKILSGAVLAFSISTISLEAAYAAEQKEAASPDQDRDISSANRVIANATINLEAFAFETEQGAATAYAQLRTTARRACLVRDNLVVPRRRFIDELCVSEIVQAAVEQIDSPNLTAHHSAAAVSRTATD